jgi:uncharacterized protein YcfJ
MGWTKNRRLCVSAFSGFLATLPGLSLTSSANAQFTQNYNTRNGALLGGVTGAVIGGVVGHQRDDTAEGALIGGAVGAIAGGVLGNQRDHAQRQNSYYAQPVYTSQPTYVQHTYVQPTHVRPTYVEHRTYVPVQPKVVTRRPVSASEVVNMTQSGVSDSVIVSHIQANGVASRPDVNEVIWMNQQGVSDYVITALQQNGQVVRTAPSNTTVYRSYPSEVVVREEYPQRTVITTPTYRPATRPVYVDRRGF